ncbi:MAG: tetratricopeptide repeat protein [Planctomycetes bacterium]|nr:tetratricopeptide repeat protein [Planctomycetota bacterium]
MLTVNVEAEFDSARLMRAIAHLESAVRADPKNLRYRKVLAEAYLAAHRFDAALDQLRAIRPRRSDPRVEYLLAYTCYRLGELDEASALLNQIDDDDQVGFSRLHQLAGRIRHDRGQFAEAVNEFAQALILSPDSPAPKWHMARSLVAHAATQGEDRLGLFRRALGLLKSIKPDPNHEDEWHETLGRIYLALHQPIEALRHLERSVRSNGAEKSLLLGLAWLLRGEDDKGRPYLREAVRNAALRPRCAAYLAEIATTPRHLLERMGLRTGRAGIPLFLDETYLGTIFGNGAPEVLQIINAGLRPRADLMGRTQAEADPDRRVDHLFAPAPRANEAEAADAGSTAGTTHPDAVATRLVESSPRSQGDRLFPRTMIELPQSDDATERVEHPIEVDEEDWDIGLAELDGPPASGDRTAQMPIQDDEEDERR